MLDGYDVQSIGYVAPALVRDWHVSSAALGPVFSAALVGVLIGSLFFSSLADRIGRRPVLIAGTFLFSALTLLTARVTTIDELLAIRLLAGIGLGGIMPNAMALVGEYAPEKIRVTAMMVVSCGFTAGAAIGGFIAAWLIPAYGWRSVFLFGGTIPLIVAVLMIFMNLLNLYFLSNWIPTLARNSGLTTKAAVLAGATVQLGGTIGAFGGAWFINRAGFVRALSATFIVGGIAVACIGQPTLSLPLFFLAVFTAGWCIPGGQPAVNALAGIYYPTHLRATGIGWGLGIGRLGAIAGPLLGGILIAHNWTMRDMFLLAALPAVISAAAILGLSDRVAAGGIESI